MPEVFDASLLGRKYVPDDRDYALEDFLATDPLQAALNAMVQGSHGAAEVRAWAVIATARILGSTPSPTPAPSGKIWQDSDAVLDQGNFGTCVGNGWAQWGNTDPVNDNYDETAARAIYYEATVIDGQPDNPDSPGGGQQGSSVRSGAKAMQNRKRLNAYAFTTSVDTVRTFIDQHGPVVFGTNWTQGMFTPDGNGYVSPADGQVAGGHCYLCVGDLRQSNALIFQNSWGNGWGINGRFLMTYADAQSLLNAQGEACAAVELP